MSEWIETNLPWYYYSFTDAPKLAEEYKRYREEEKPKSFTGRGLNIPGTLIELDNGHQYLIGDINELGGVCDDCSQIRFDTIIKRYKVVWKPE